MAIDRAWMPTLLLGLEGLQGGALGRHVCIDQVADAGGQAVAEVRHEGQVRRHLIGLCAQLGHGQVHLADRGVDGVQEVGGLGRGGEARAGRQRQVCAAERERLGSKGQLGGAVGVGQCVDGRRATGDQVLAVEAGVVHRALDLGDQRLEVGVERSTVRGGNRGIRRFQRLGLDLVQQVRDGLAGGDRHVQHGGGAVQRVGHRGQGGDLGALSLRDVPDRAVVLGPGDAQGRWTLRSGRWTVGRWCCSGTAGRRVRLRWC